MFIAATAGIDCRDIFLERATLDSDLRVFRTIEELHAKSATSLVRKIASLSHFRARIHLAFSSGIATQAWLDKFVQILAANPKEVQEWSPVHLWCADEVYVPAGDPRRVDTRLQETLVDRFPQLFSLHQAPSFGEGSLGDAARAYSTHMRETFSRTRLIDPRSISMDIALLHIGVDGHLAALYPSHESLTRSGLVLPVPHCPEEPRERLTMSVPLLRRSRYTWFIASGPKVAPVLAHSLHGADFRELPSAVMNQVGTTWWCDTSAASRVALGVN
ncbi:MAG: 6-phosphogluconolactonase [Actinomycetaceae bacterium]|nr:6-phosphogluconolactonase [Actinomycetaceae bacterium]